MNGPRPPTHCPECNQPFDNPADRAFGACAQARCRGPFLHKRRLAAETKRRAWRTEFASQTLANYPQLRTAVEHLTAADASPPAKVVVVVVPSFDREPTELPVDRKAQFVAYLESTLAQAVEIVAAGRKHDNLRTEFAHRQGIMHAGSPAIVINGCSTCRGFCCQHGGTTAFLTPAFLAWQMLTGQVTVASLRQFYVDRLPSESISDSCVYHTPRGCCLPRDARNEICNNFHCDGLMDASDSFDEQPAVYSIALATDGDRTYRIGLMSPEGSRREFAGDDDGAAK